MGATLPLTVVRIALAAAMLGGCAKAGSRDAASAGVSPAGGRSPRRGGDADDGIARAR